MTELKWKHDNYHTMHCVTDHNYNSDGWKHNNCCNVDGPCYHEGCKCRKDNQRGLEVLTPHPKKRNIFERFLNRYNHIMEFSRTILSIITVTLQLIILYKLIT